MKQLLFLILIFSAALSSFAQVPASKNISNQRKKTITVSSSVVPFDSLSVVPNSVHILGVPDSSFTVDFVNATLTWKQRPPIDTLVMVYRVFPAKLNAVASHMHYDSLINFFLAKPYIMSEADKNANNFFNFGNLTYNGSFGRGISFGNSQDVVVTSNLNLQLSGYLADSIQILAAITDNNIPIQPDGTTQQLNEFDRVFLQFKKKGWQLSLGDIDLRQNKNYFLNFYKRLQGATFENTGKLAPGITNTILVSGSIAKGKFTRNVFQGQEGNQGPYRLQGANNEFYFVILGGTEKVFLDGILLQRGEDQDYIINYNTAEITFTPRRMITKDSRIQVEFEYADRNYLNTNLYLSNETNFNNKLKLRVAAYSNGDAKNSPINQSLDSTQKRFLNEIGDSVNRAFYPVATLDTFSANKILYAKIDTLVNGLHDSIYVYSTSPDSAKYNLSFTEVGAGNGDYIPDLNGANGKVYKWVAPVNGKAQGNFEAATFLVTPKKQSVVTVGADYNISKHTTVTGEMAYSHYDVNLFSQKDKTNDNGYAGKFVIKDVHPLKSRADKKLQLVSNAGVEWVQAQFQPIERLRNVEYTRDWGLPLVTTPATETFITAGTELQDKMNNRLRYDFNSYIRSDGFNGIRNIITQQQDIKGFRFNNQINLTNSVSSTDKGYFFRPTFDVSKLLKNMRNYVIGASYSLEHNEIRNKISDTINANSFSFQTIQAYLKSDESKYNKWGVTYFNRTDSYPYGKDLKRADRSNNINVFAELLKNPKNQLRVNATYRKLDVLQKDITSQTADESLLARAEYQANVWKGFASGNILYEVGAGQEQKRDYAYLEVPAGQGQYTWIDYNNDGVQQLNEFELAQFQDQAKYIRIFTPTNEFVKANYNTFNYSISLNPRSIIDPKHRHGFKKVLSNINFQSSLQISKKEIAQGFIQLNPFAKAINDTSLLTLANVFSNTFAYNRFSPKWGFDVTNLRNNGKALLTYGLESRQTGEWGFKPRLNITRKITLDANFKKGYNRLTTESNKFDNRNFSINQWSAEPRVTFTQSSTFRILASYKYMNRENQIGDNEKYTSNALNSEVKYNLLQNTSIQGKFTFNQIKYPFPTNTTVSYTMLDGLLPGKNYLWTLDITKRLANNLEINLQYEGRKPGDGKTVNVGRASLRALL